MAIVAGMIVGAGQRQQRIEQARLLQAEEHGIGAQQRAQAAVAQLVIGQPGIFASRFGLPISARALAAALEDAQNIARLRNFPARQRIEIRQDALGARQLRASAAGTS